MFRVRFAVVAVTFLLLPAFFAWALAQPSPEQRITEIRIVGTDNEILRNLIRVNLNARPGTTVGSIRLEAERNRVATIGEFATVSVSIEDRGNGPLLIVSVEENPPIAEIVIEGNEALASPTGVSVTDEELLRILDRENLVREGVIYNSLYAQDAITTLQRVYRSLGWPVEVPVELSVEPATPDEAADEAGQDEPAEAPTVPDEGEEPDREVEGKTPVRLTFTITEAVPLDEVVIEESAVLPQEQLERIFAPLERADTFDFPTYAEAVAAVQEAYEAEGYRLNQVDAEATSLEGGTLNLALREYRITGFDTTAVGIDPSELSLEPGDAYNHEQLLRDIQRLAAGRSIDMSFTPLRVGDESVRVIFESGPPESAGPIEDIAIEGNTVFSDEQIRDLLLLEVGDTFTSGLAAEDFRAIIELYSEAGYRIVVDPENPGFNYLDGTYVQNIREVRISDYEVRFEEEGPRTDPTVITRYLPEPGSVFNQDEVLAGLRNVFRLGIVEPTGLRVDTPDRAQPTEGVVVVGVRERRTGTFSPSLTYSTDDGLSASVSYSETNLFGKAHRLSGNITAQTSDIGFLLGGSVSYSIPWLYIDFLDFQEVPTSVSAEIFSDVSSNRALTASGSLTVCFDPGATSCPDDERVLVGEYTQRDSGLSFSVGRPIFENTVLRFSARGVYTDYSLEPPDETCSRDPEGDVGPDGCAIGTDRSAAYLPQSGLSSFVSTSLTYDTRENPDFPIGGVTATASLGIGFGSDYRDPDTLEQQSYVYEQVELTGSTYVQLQDILPAVGNPDHVFAFRLSFGHQFGGDYPASKYFFVGDIADPNREIRGFTREDFDPSRTYVTGSMEYRYNFGFDTFATQTVIGLLFADFGYSSSVPLFEDYATPVFAGAGFGVQLNLDPGGIFLPLRLQYAFSERNPGGVFRLRVGPLF